MRMADRSSRALDPSRREVLRAGVIAGVSVVLAPLGSPAYAALFDEKLLTPPAWTGATGALRYRIDGLAKVTGQKIFARDIRARDMPHWPPAQAHALVLRVTKADRLYTGFDISILGAELKPDRVVTAADLARDDLGSLAPHPRHRTRVLKSSTLACGLSPSFSKDTGVSSATDPQIRTTTDDHV